METIFSNCMFFIVFISQFKSRAINLMQIGRFIRAARSLAQRGVPVIAVSLHTDALLDRLPGTVWKICAWQHDAMALAAVERLLSGRG